MQSHAHPRTLTKWGSVNRNENNNQQPTTTMTMGTKNLTRTRYYLQNIHYLFASSWFYFIFSCFSLYRFTGSNWSVCLCKYVALMQHRCAHRRHTWMSCLRCALQCAGVCVCTRNSFSRCISMIHCAHRRTSSVQFVFFSLCLHFFYRFECWPFVFFFFCALADAIDWFSLHCMLRVRMLNITFLFNLLIIIEEETELNIHTSHTLSIVFSFFIFRPINWKSVFATVLISFALLFASSFFVPI